MGEGQRAREGEWRLWERAEGAQGKEPVQPPARIHTHHTLKQSPLLEAAALLAASKLAVVGEEMPPLEADQLASPKRMTQGMLRVEFLMLPATSSPQDLPRQVVLLFQAENLA
jgi:hypothetical protein